MERFSIWNAAGFSLLLGASGTREAQLEQLGTIWNYLERRRLLACSLAPYPYSKMCELCELCELFVKKLLSKTECAILTDCALFTL